MFASRGEGAVGWLPQDQGSPDQLWVCHSVSLRARPQGAWLLGAGITPPAAAGLATGVPVCFVSVCEMGCTSSCSGAVFLGACIQVLATGETGIQGHLLGSTTFSAVYDNVLY